MNPEYIRFTQVKISGAFKDGGDLHQTIEDLHSGKLSTRDFPPIRIFWVNGTIYSLDNRRLYVFKQSRMPIGVQPATLEEIRRESFKMDTPNCGVSVQLRSTQNQ